MTTTDKPSIAELQRMCATLLDPAPLESVDHWSKADNAQIALRNAAPVLLEIAAAGKAWQEARDASIGDAYLRCPAGPSKKSQQELSEAVACLLAALAKVTP